MNPKSTRNHAPVRLPPIAAFPLFVLLTLASFPTLASEPVVPPETLGLRCDRAVMISHPTTCSGGGAFWGDFASIPLEMSSESIEVCNNACQSCCENQRADQWLIDFVVQSVGDFCQCAEAQSPRNFRVCVRERILDQLNIQFQEASNGEHPDQAGPQWFTVFLATAGLDLGSSGNLIDLLNREEDILEDNAYRRAIFAWTRFLRASGMARLAMVAVGICSEASQGLDPDNLEQICLDRCNNTYPRNEEPTTPITTIPPQTPTGPTELPKRPEPPGDICPGGKRPGQACSLQGRPGFIGVDCRCETFGPLVCLPPPGTPCGHGGVINSACDCETITVIDGWPPTYGGGTGHDFVCPACHYY